MSSLEQTNFQSTSHKWKVKFLDLGWKEDIPFYLIDFLNSESMPLAPQEDVILSSEISPITTIKGLLYRTNVFWNGVTGTENSLYQVRPNGGIAITVKRMIVYSFTKGWVLILPFACLLRISVEDSSDSSTFQLEFENRLAARLFKRIPSFGPKNSENTYFDKSLHDARKNTIEENRVWESFFDEIIKNKKLIFNQEDFQLANRLISKKYLFKRVPKIKIY